MPFPLLTIITVTKNCVETLERTLLSVQTIKNEDIEYLVIDGVSTDGTLELVNSHTVVDRFISEPDTGIYNAMNKGVELAQGMYVLFINGDDELVEDGFPEVMQALREKKANIVCATTLVGSLISPSEILIAKPWHLLFFNSIPHPSAFVSTSLMKKYRFREDIRIASDYGFFLRAYLDHTHFVIVPAVTALHHRGGASADTYRSLAEIKKIRMEHLGWRYYFFEGVRASYGAIKKKFHSVSK
jgi:glycosyltransferase involved in cell wall biosynthesis